MNQKRNYNSLIKENNQTKDLEILRFLEEKQKVSQRDLSEHLGVSLGKVNFILKALIEKGIVKARNFKNNKNKRAYAYYLTPAGIKEKAILTVNFFKRKMTEYDDLRKELEELESEVKKIKDKVDNPKEDETL